MVKKSDRARVTGPMDGQIPWGLLARMGSGTLSAGEIEAVAPVLQWGRVQPPDWFIARAATSPGREATDAEGIAAGLRRRITGMLVVPGAPGMTVMPVRETLRHRRMILMAGRVTAHLEVREAPDAGVAVAGQIIAPSTGGFTIELQPQDKDNVVITVTSSELGFFSFIAPHGTYTLILRSDDDEIEFTPLFL